MNNGATNSAEETVYGSTRHIDGLAAARRSHAVRPALRDPQVPNGALRAVGVAQMRHASGEKICSAFLDGSFLASSWA